MEAIVERACGLDVHQRTVVACMLRGTPTQRPQKEVRTAWQIDPRAFQPPCRPRFMRRGAARPHGIC
jgi:hypothetical protein